MSRPFTRAHKVLSDLFPACLGSAPIGIITMLVTEPNWTWALYAVPIALVVPGALARWHKRRRNRELDLVSHQRGWRAAQSELHVFTEAEVNELGLLNGHDFAQAVLQLADARRDADAGVEKL